MSVMVVRLGDALILVGAAASILFLVLYARTAKWWRSEWGWHLMLAGASLAALLLLAAAGIFQRTEWPALSWTRLVLILLVVSTTVWRTALLIRAQLAARRERKAQRATEDSHV